MEIMKILYVVIIILCQLGKIMLIGEERKPYARGEVVFDIIINSGLIYVLIN